MRHWSMLRKLGLTGTKPQSKNAKKETSATPKKRGAARESAENGNDGDGDGDGEEEPETPSKKVKRECA